VAGEAHVVVVGAGPGGASLAWLLARAGIRVTLLERQSDFAREFRGEVLMPSGIDALSQMGLEKAFAGVPQCEVGAIEAYRDGRRLFRLELDEAFLGGPPPRAVSQPAMLEMLVAEAARHPSFRLERGATVRDLVYEGERIAGVRAALPDGEREVRGDLVVGADGRASILRRRAGLHEERFPVSFDVVWVKVALPAAFADAPPIRAYLGRGHLLICFRSYDDRLQIGWIIEKGAFGDLRRRGAESWIEEMAEHVSEDLAGHLRTQREALGRPFLLDAISDRLERWTAPGLLMIGDAAHPMSPVGAQGINIALRDAIVAANWLVPALSNGSPAPDALDAATRGFQSERLPEVSEIQRLQAGPPAVILRRAWWSGIALRLLPLLLRLDFVRGRSGVFVRRFAFGTADVTLQV
jgi:2-polyprenyl-6-methoxyphenol hydroxylase-like FAD-dependent oxidoreductase